MILSSAIISLLLAAGQDASAAAPPPMAPTFANVASGGQAVPAIADWWRAFNDPALDALIDEALAQNLDIAEAGARLDRARSGTRAADGARLPTISLTGDTAAARLSFEDPQLIGVRSVPGFDRNQEQYAIGIGASWEIDLFGRLDARARTARANAAASAFEVEAARLAVTTEIADRYVALRLLQQRRSVAARRAGTLDELSRLSAMRVERGVSPAIERDRLLAEARSAAAVAPALSAAIEDQLARIDVLAGREVGTARRTLADTAAMPSIAMIDLATTPAELLRRRPDVLAAEADVAARDAQVSAALADRLPRFNLAGLIGTLAGSINPLFGAAAFTAQGSGGIGYNAFDGGRSRAAVDAARADVRGAAARYQRTVLNAVADVEVAAAAATSAETRAGQLREAEERLDATLNAVCAGQRQGALSLSDLLDVDRRLQDARDARLIAEADRAFAAVAMLRALGGGARP